MNQNSILLLIYITDSPSIISYIIKIKTTIVLSLIKKILCCNIYAPSTKMKSSCLKVLSIPCKK